MSGALIFLHGVTARALLIYSVALALWGTYLYFRRSALTGSFRSAFLILAGLTVLQGLFGVAVLLTGQRPSSWPLHLVYGIFAGLFLPGLYFYAQGGSKAREAVFLAGAAWVVAIAYFRGIATG